MRNSSSIRDNTRLFSLDDPFADQSIQSYRLGLSLLFLIPLALLIFHPQPSVPSLMVCFLATFAGILVSFHPLWSKNATLCLAIPAVLVGGALTYNACLQPHSFLPIFSLYLIWLYSMSRLPLLVCLAFGVIFSTSAYVAVIFWSMERLPLPHLATLDGMNLMLVCSMMLAEKRLTLLNKQMRHISHSAQLDELTLLPRRQQLLKTLADFLEQHHLQPFHFSVMLVSLEGLHRYNQAFGFGTGDRMLKYLSGALLAMTHAPNLIGRYGDRQFLMILPGSNLAMANMMAHRLQSHLKRHPILLSDEHIPLTVRMGILSLHRSHSSLEDLLKRLDQMILRAHVSGHQNIASDELG